MNSNKLNARKQIKLIPQELLRAQKKKIAMAYFPTEKQPELIDGIYTRDFARWDQCPFPESGTIVDVVNDDGEVKGIMQIERRGVGFIDVAGCWCWVVNLESVNPRMLKKQKVIFNFTFPFIHCSATRNR